MMLPAPHVSHSVLTLLSCGAHHGPPHPPSPHFVARGNPQVGLSFPYLSSLIRTNFLPSRHAAHGRLYGNTSFPSTAPLLSSVPGPWDHLRLRFIESGSCSAHLGGISRARSVPSRSLIGLLLCFSVVLHRARLLNAAEEVFGAEVLRNEPERVLTAPGVTDSANMR